MTSAAPRATALGTQCHPAQWRHQSISPIVCDTEIPAAQRLLPPPLLPLRPAQQPPRGSCGPPVAQVSTRQGHWGHPEPPATHSPSSPTRTGVSWGGQLPPARGQWGRGAVLLGTAPGTAPAQNPVMLRGVCTLRLLCAAELPPPDAGATASAALAQGWSGTGLRGTWQPERWGDLSDAATRQPLIETQKKFFEGSKMSGQSRNSSRFETTDALVRADECWLVKSSHFSPWIAFKVCQVTFQHLCGQKETCN